MRKAYKLQDLDCANCAAKMETAISAIEGVNSASISFMTSKLMLDMDETHLDSILDQAQQCISKYEPDCKIVA